MIRAALAPLLLIASGVASDARADMTLVMHQSGDDIAMRLVGSIDTSVFDRPPFVVGTSSPSSFQQATFPVDEFPAGGGRRVGIEEISRVWTREVDLLGYRFYDNDAITPIGNRPAFEAVIRLNTPAPFWFGFADRTITGGVDGGIGDGIFLSDGYVSNSELDIIHIEPSRTLESLGLQIGDFWGATFVGGAGGTQTMAFKVIPEPSTVGLTLLFGVAGNVSRRRAR